MTSKPRPQAPGRSALPAAFETLPAAQQAGAGDAPAAPAQPGDQRLAALGYLGVPLLGPCLPLLIYLFSKRKSGYVRRHSAQAVNLSLTAALYGICGLIAWAMLALDSIDVALMVVVPLVAVLWLVSLGYAVMASVSASRGGCRRIPAWLCATIVR